MACHAEKKSAKCSMSTASVLMHCGLKSLLAMVLWFPDNDPSPMKAHEANGENLTQAMLN